MYLPSMILPPDALLGFPALAARMSFGDVRDVGPWGLVPVGVAIALAVALGVARRATRRHERSVATSRAARAESYRRAA